MFLKKNMIVKHSLKLLDWNCSYWWDELSLLLQRKKNRRILCAAKDFSDNIFDASDSAVYHGCARGVYTGSGG